jgi:hypothetical protein
MQPRRHQLDVANDKKRLRPKDSVLFLNASSKGYVS